MPRLFVRLLILLPRPKLNEIKCLKYEESKEIPRTLRRSFTRSEELDTFASNMLLLSLTFSYREDN